MLDSDSEDEAPPAQAQSTSHTKDVDVIQQRLAAQKLEADRTGELQRLQERQKRESAKRERKRFERQASMVGTPARGQSRGHPDLEDLDFGSISGSGKGLPAPLHPDSDRESVNGGCVQSPLYLFQTQLFGHLEYRADIRGGQVTLRLF